MMTLKDRLAAFVEIKPTGEDNDHIVLLHVENQYFQFYTGDTKEDAEWYKEMVVIALERMVNKVRPA
jgi:hypothetical protein